MFFLFCFLRAAEDTFFGEYFIPKGTIVMPNLWAVHMDPKLWKNPEDFDPSRFLEEGGKRAAKPEHLIPFSLGKLRTRRGKPTV